MNFHNKEKVWENTKIPTKLRVSYIFHMKQKSIKFPNHGMSGVPYFKAMLENTMESRIIYPACGFLGKFEIIKKTNILFRGIP